MSLGQIFVILLLTKVLKSITFTIYYDELKTYVMTNWIRDSLFCFSWSKCKIIRIFDDEQQIVISISIHFSFQVCHELMVGQGKKIDINDIKADTLITCSYQKYTSITREMRNEKIWNRLLQLTKWTKSGIPFTMKCFHYSDPSWIVISCDGHINDRTQTSIPSATKKKKT